MLHKQWRSSLKCRRTCFSTMQLDIVTFLLHSRDLSLSFALPVSNSLCGCAFKSGNSVNGGRFVCAFGRTESFLRLALVTSNTHCVYETNVPTKYMYR